MYLWVPIFIVIFALAEENMSKAVSKPLLKIEETLFYVMKTMIFTTEWQIKVHVWG